jgi:hypothetical protein
MIILAVVFVAGVAVGHYVLPKVLDKLFPKAAA